MTVLDASAVLALLNDEPGAAMVAAELQSARLSMANLAEILGKVGDVGADPRVTIQLLRAAGVVMAPVTEADAELAAAIRSIDGGSSLSLGDRCCLAFALRSDPPTVLTADRAWSKLKLPLQVHLIR